MALAASDELRHLPTGDPLWRESVYWNFNDPENGIGAWIYVWVIPGRPSASGMIIGFYHGGWPDSQIYDKAMASPGHLLREGKRWVYCFQKQSEELAANDFDCIDACGLSLRRRRPLSCYELTFDDGTGNSFSLESEFLERPFDYANGFHPTPSWLATNRYHRSHRIRGKLHVGGRRYLIDCTGDSDHSWGTRDWSVFARHRFKMWSFQSPDGQLSSSVIDQETAAGHVALGYVSIGGVTASAKRIRSNADFDKRGVQHHIHVEVEDDLGRMTRAFCREMHSYIGWGTSDQFWGYEGVGRYEVDGLGVVSGASSFFWPSDVLPSTLCVPS